VKLATLLSAWWQASQGSHAWHDVVRLLLWCRSQCTLHCGDTYRWWTMNAAQSAAATTVLYDQCSKVSSTKTITMMLNI
jgi:hypothetical protein